MEDASGENVNNRKKLKKCSVLGFSLGQAEQKLLTLRPRNVVFEITQQQQVSCENIKQLGGPEKKPCKLGTKLVYQYCPNMDN